MQDIHVKVTITQPIETNKAFCVFSAVSALCEKVQHSISCNVKLIACMQAISNKYKWTKTKIEDTLSDSA